MDYNAMLNDFMTAINFTTADFENWRVFVRTMIESECLDEYIECKTTRTYIAYLINHLIEKWKTHEVKDSKSVTNDKDAFYVNRRCDLERIMKIVDKIFDATSSSSKFADIEDMLDELFEIEHIEIEPFYEILHKKINAGNYSVNFICDELLDIHTVCAQWILFYTICVQN